jgi:hypothetical protein
MVTRERLTIEQWLAVRDTPHHVIIAVSSTGGSPFDEMLERSAGLQGIVDAMHSTHPLLREIAASHHIMQAQDNVRAWYYTLEEVHRTPTNFQSKALDTFSQSLGHLNTHGGLDDLLHYSDFVISLAMRVARAAREGDLLGIGGELVSSPERQFIRRLELCVEQVNR